MIAACATIATETVRLIAPVAASPVSVMKAAVKVELAPTVAAWTEFARQAVVQRLAAAANKLKAKD